MGKIKLNRHMKKLFYFLSIVLATSIQAQGQNPILTLDSHPVDKSLIKEKTYEMAWYIAHII